MGTRGTFGYRKNKQDKLMYNHWDSYPDGLGQRMLEYIKMYSTKEINDTYDNIKIVEADNDDKYWKISAEMERKIHSRDVFLSSFHEDPTLLIPEDNNFIKDSLFCEWGYIVNLDTECLEVWEGFQKKAQKGNRYGRKKNGDGYYPCKLITEIPFDDLRKDKVQSLEMFLNIQE